MRQSTIFRSLLVFVTFCVILPSTTCGKDKPAEKQIRTRYGVRADVKKYPQSDPQQAIRSVIKAVAAGDIEYMLAHLVSPTQVDQKLGGSQEAFKKLAVKPSAKKAKILNESLKRKLSDGTWTIRRNLAWATAKGTPDLSLEQVGDRWFMHNTPVPQPKDWTPFR